MARKSYNYDDIAQKAVNPGETKENKAAAARRMRSLDSAEPQSPTVAARQPKPQQAVSRDQLERKAKRKIYLRNKNQY